MQASIHLLSSSIFVFVFLAGVFSVPLLFFLGDLIEMGFNKDFFAYFMVGLLSVIAVYYVANVEATHQDESLIKSILKFVFLFPLFLALSMGLSLHNTVAVISGLSGKKVAFCAYTEVQYQKHYGYFCQKPIRDAKDFLDDHHRRIAGRLFYRGCDRCGLCSEHNLYVLPLAAGNWLRRDLHLHFEASEHQIIDRWIS
jgi:hypothetical protein